jgi:hypothetical protein
MDGDADNERWRELFERAHDGVFLLDLTDGRFVVRRFNPAEERFTDCAPTKKPFAPAVLASKIRAVLDAP